jgi:peptidoglycan/xylan/chitin deacetylase (PgdA/CDA1 family)
MGSSSLRARISNRLAMHLPVSTARLSNTQPMVSFTFDDIPRSAATNGAAALEAYCAKATFYVSGGMVGDRTPHWEHASADDLLALYDNGHELACHTYSHRRVCDLNAKTINWEIERNRAYLKSLRPSIRIENFAYPFGWASLTGKYQLRTPFKSSRGIVPGINHGNIDLQLLKAVPLIDGQVSHHEIDQWMDAAVASNGWLIFYTHDVVDAPSIYGCSLKSLDFALAAAARRKIAIRSVAEALKVAQI